MARAKTARKTKSSATRNNPFQLKKAEAAERAKEPQVHIYGPGAVCDTEKRGQAMPRGLSRTEIVVDASEGFIPLWESNTILRWRFQKRSFDVFANPAAAKAEVKKLFGNALLAWGDATPIGFTEEDDAWDFEIVMRDSDRCSISGCVLASAFFPDRGRHELILYPKMFEQSEEEQLETLVHEIGHIFGLRHFFANISETDWPSEIFGTHKPFSIMNYGDNSKLTDIDKSDLKDLYQGARSGQLTTINGTPIRLVKPYHTTGGV